jgi:hypothetical protein
MTEHHYASVQSFLSSLAGCQLPTVYVTVLVLTLAMPAGLQLEACQMYPAVGPLPRPRGTLVMFDKGLVPHQRSLSASTR